MSTEQSTHTRPEVWTGFVGRTEDGDRVFVTVTLTRRNGYLELTFSADAYAASRALTGDIVSGGQITGDVRDVMTSGELASHLDAHELESLLRIWRRWHLNGWHGHALPAWIAERARAFGALLDNDGDQSEADDAVETITWNDAADRFEEMLDSCYPEVEIGYLTFAPGRIMRELDESGFDAGVIEWAENEGVEIA